MVLNWIKQNRGLASLVGTVFLAGAVAVGGCRAKTQMDTQARLDAEYEASQNRIVKAEAEESALMGMNLVLVPIKYGDTLSRISERLTGNAYGKNSLYAHTAGRINGVVSADALMQAGTSRWFPTTDETARKDVKVSQYIR